MAVKLTSALKLISIQTGLYRQARWLSRRLRPTALRWHRQQVEFYQSLLPSGTTCCDVGANIGEMSEAMLRAGLRVVAFEPNPLVLPELSARLAHEKDWTLIPAAVGSGGAIMILNAPIDSGKANLLEASEQRRELLGRFHVPVVTMDAAIREFGVPSYCKIDVEGWEQEVLRGLSQPIPLLSFEFNLSEAGIARTLACLSRLQEIGRWSVNITPAESSFFFLKEWESIEHFAGWFPGDLKHTLPLDTYGDIFVKNQP